LFYVIDRPADIVPGAWRRSALTFALPYVLSFALSFYHAARLDGESAAQSAASHVIPAMTQPPLRSNS
jgi:hypothetical protein